VALRWDDIDLTTGRLHVRRAKGGDASVHPISARESRALRKLLREADQGDGSRPGLASVLQEGGQSANMNSRSRAIWQISAKYPFTNEMKTLLAGLIVIHSWYPNECCADKDCHPVPSDEISEGENGAMHWKNLIFEGSQIRTSPDSECHVCHLLEEGRPVIPICIFTQKKPSA
jgi:hypothetical protein